ncbi:hypothetical protein DFJ74DRAFT_689413 [Hyaloraphidium curvatum]|nr:hypothetical protein DFJ74DRAFT_689413 [Hyaloraphidium curvatum]
MTVTPTLHPSNTILRADCTYLPVPYVLADASKTAANTFQIELVSCSPNKTFDSHFVTAAQKWMSVITADVSNINAAAQNPNPLASCVGSNLGTNVMSCPVVDDLIIAFTVEAIDGPFGVLGQAGPALSRPNSVPVTGYMRFDIDDVDRVYGQGVLEDLILHEMGHVLGIGTLWKGRGLLSPSNCSDYIGTGAEPAGARFTGAQANASLSVVDPSDSLGLGYVPVEDKFNQTGTTCSHWKEDAFKRELMTGFLSDRGNPLSVVTVRSLADLGYTVDINSPAIDSTFDLATATQDEMPGAKPEVVLPLVGCLGHGAEPVELPGYLFGKG